MKHIFHLLKLTLIIASLLLLVPSPVKADTCGGYVECCDSIYDVYQCSISGDYCDPTDPNACDFGSQGNCNFAYKGCDGSYEPGCFVTGGVCKNHACKDGQVIMWETYSCGWISTPDPTATPIPPPPDGNCDASCGTCGYRNASNKCETNWGCCHRTCSGPSCITIFGSGSNECDEETEAEDCGDITPTPGPPTPTPTPYIKVNLENPEGGPVSREICPAECDAFFGGCLQSNPPACSTTNSYIFPKTMDQWNGSYQGAGVTLSNDIVTSVNPNPGGGQADSDANHHYYSWPDWSDGERQVTFVLATPTPTPTPASINFNLYETDGPNSCTANSNDTSVSPDNFNIKSLYNIPITSFSSSRGSFTYSNPESGPYTLDPASQWICAGAKYSASCSQNNCVGPSGETQIDYYVTQIKPAWWQTKCGNVHSQSSISVDIPCPGHAPLISNEVKTIPGVKGSEYSFPNNFEVYYDSSQTSEGEILALEVFDEYPATKLNQKVNEVSANAYSSGGTCGGGCGGTSSCGGSCGSPTCSYSS